MVQPDPFSHVFDAYTMWLVHSKPLEHFQFQLIYAARLTVCLAVPDVDGMKRDMAMAIIAVSGGA
jgi:hypothetical protein